MDQRDAFKVIGEFRVADLYFEILESHGGHVPAQIFLFEPNYGMLFCGDYLIDVPSLSDRTKSTLFHRALSDDQYQQRQPSVRQGNAGAKRIAARYTDTAGASREDRHDLSRSWGILPDYGDRLALIRPAVFLFRGQKKPPEGGFFDS